MPLAQVGASGSFAEWRGVSACPPRGRIPPASCSALRPMASLRAVPSH